jgi:hypothetical protein
MTPEFFHTLMTVRNFYGVGRKVVLTFRGQVRYEDEIVEGRKFKAEVIEGKYSLAVYDDNYESVFMQDFPTLFDIRELFNRLEKERILQVEADIRKAFFGYQEN